MTLLRLETMEPVELLGVGGDWKVGGRTQQQHDGAQQGAETYLKGPLRDDRLTMQEWSSSINN